MVVGKDLFAESAVVNVVSVVHIEMNLDLGLLGEALAARQSHELNPERTRIDIGRDFQAHKALFEILLAGAAKADMLA